MSDKKGFVAGTQVIMRKGTKAIEDINVNDVVKTINGEKKVIKTYNSEKPMCYKLIFSDGTKLTCSEDQKFYMATGTYKEAKNISDGERLWKPDDAFVSMIDSTELCEKPVFSIDVEGNEDFILTSLMRVC